MLHIPMSKKKRQENKRKPLIELAKKALGVYLYLNNRLLYSGKVVYRFIVESFLPDFHQTCEQSNWGQLSFVAEGLTRSGVSP